MTTDSQNLIEAAAKLRKAERIVVFTGAGVSAESGIDTFRDNAGLWQRFPPEHFATWPGLLRTAFIRPCELANFLYAVLGPVATAKPNSAHETIAHAESVIEIVVVTQNVDRLHQDAGSTVVREIHGSLFEIVTLRGRFVRLLSRAQLCDITDGLERAMCGWLALPRIMIALRSLAGITWRGIIRPKIVLFGEALTEPDWSAACEDARQCDVVLVVGTSGLVYPAAMLPYKAKEASATVITIDPIEPGAADIWLCGTACGVLPKLFKLAFERD